MNQFVKHSSIQNGFKNAISGFFWSIQSQVNFRLHLLFATLAIALGFLLKVNYYEWLLLITAIFFTLVLELINTSIEQTTDAITKEFHPIIKRAKDVSAAAVLIYALYSLILGVLIFGSKLI